MFILSVIALPALLWLGFVFVYGGNSWFEFDFNHTPGSYFDLLEHYARFFRLIAIVGVGLGIAATVMHLPGGKELAVAGLFAILYKGAAVYFYEGYLGTRYPSYQDANFNGRRYALLCALGWSSIALFILGFLGLLSGL